MVVVEFTKEHTSEVGLGDQELDDKQVKTFSVVLSSNVDPLLQTTVTVESTDKVEGYVSSKLLVELSIEKSMQEPGLLVVVEVFKVVDELFPVVLVVACGD